MNEKNGRLGIFCKHCVFNDVIKGKDLSKAAQISEEEYKKIKSHAKRKVELENQVLLTRIGKKMKIVAIGGNVIKTAWDEIKEVANQRLFDVLIHNGGSVFHDFQRATEDLAGHSYPLDDLLIDYECNRKSSELVWHWIKTGCAPEGSLTQICNRNGIEVLIFTALGVDFWQLFNGHWDIFAFKTKRDFEVLCNIMKKPFHYICMGSAVIHPEVFVKALAVAKPKGFQADVVDFLPDQYRPKTRVAKYGKYHCMSQREFLTNWLEDENSKK